MGKTEMFGNDDAVTRIRVLLLMSLLEDLAGSPEFEEPHIFYVQLRTKPSSAGLLLLA
ncbi:Hypothetical protein SMAX5B_014774 [Scophthalmus maximus]|uniref:Uncharacterized protein n=1 Tax=Scophthalmus maximus TaxID=52904 RepID=A0A2U9BZJ1_SCOMX|nr:Hypothetical protein SMAX5B_014774 [Scophthalmus maximus]